MKVYIGDTVLIDDFNIKFYELIKPVHTRVIRRGRTGTVKWFNVRQSNDGTQTALFVDDTQEIRFHLESNIDDYLVLLQAHFQTESDVNGAVIWEEKSELEDFYNTTLKGALGVAQDVFPLAWIDALMTEEAFLDLGSF